MLGPLLFSLYINDLKHILKLEGDDDPQKEKDDKLQIYLPVVIKQLERGFAALTSK